MPGGTGKWAEKLTPVRDGIPWVWCLNNLKKGLYFLFTSNYHYVYRDVKLVGSPAEASAARS
jgi:hypothetical protein